MLFSLRLFCIIIFLVLTNWFTISISGENQAYKREIAQRADGSSIVYYLQLPINTDQKYPMVVLCDGSYEPFGTIQNVLPLHDFFAQLLESCNVGLLTVEKWGVDGNHVDKSLFHSHNTRSQRTQDHLDLLQLLDQKHIPGWNGKYVVIGGSEGGDVITRLMLARAESIIAAIN